MEVKEVAKWFLKKDNSLCNGYNDENTRLNKLLYFSSLMFYSVFESELFEEKFEKWENGPVLKSIYVDYRYNKLGKIKFEIEKNIDKKIEKILNIISLIYIDKTAKELSDETHKHNIWINVEKNSKIDFSKIDKKLKKQMINFYNLYKNFDFENIIVEKINGNKYLYDKNNLEITDKLLEELKKMEYNSSPQFIEMIDGEVVFS